MSRNLINIFLAGVPITDEQLNRIDAIARWYDSSRESVLEVIAEDGIADRIAKGIENMERMMQKGPSQDGHIAAMNMGGQT